VSSATRLPFRAIEVVRHFPERSIWREDQLLQRFDSVIEVLGKQDWIPCDELGDARPCVLDRGVVVMRVELVQLLPIPLGRVQRDEEGRRAIVAKGETMV